MARGQGQPNYVLKAALSSRKAAWRSLLFSSACFRSSCSAFISASNLLAEFKAWTCRETARTDQQSERGKRNLQREQPIRQNSLVSSHVTWDPGPVGGLTPAQHSLPLVFQCLLSNSEDTVTLFAAVLHMPLPICWGWLFHLSFFFRIPLTSTPIAHFYFPPLISQ